jgi:hypothetical protein
MDEIITELSGSILRVELNRPKKRNAMTSGMYVALANISTTRPRTKVHVQCSGMAREIPSVPATMLRTFSRIRQGQENLRRLG